MAKARQKTGRKKARKEVNEGVVHIQATFNNTIMTITDQQGNTLGLGVCRVTGVQGIAQVHSVCSPDRSPGGVQEGGRIRAEKCICIHQGAGRRSGVGPEGDKRERYPDHRHQGCYAHPPQRVQAPEETQGITRRRNNLVEIYRTGLQDLSQRRDEALPEGGAVLYGQVCH